MQSLSCDKLKFMVELEHENKTLKGAMAEKVTIIETKVSRLVNFDMWDIVDSFLYILKSKNTFINVDISYVSSAFYFDLYDAFREILCL